MTAKERIESLIAHLHTTVKSLSDLCGYDRPQIFYDILKGKTQNISPTLCEKLIKVLPRLNRVWLITGQGPMWLPKEEADRVNASPITQAAAIEVPEETSCMVPLVKISALAGPIESFYESGDDLVNCEKILSPEKQAEMAVPISGDSMEPVFHDGSVAFIKRINEVAFIPWGHPLVLDTENGVFIKIVMPDDDNAQYIWAESYNPRYPRMHVPKKSVYGMYRVLNVSKSYQTL